MKVKAIQFVPLGRPPKEGEWARDNSRPTSPYFVSAWDRTDSPEGHEAYERREVEVDVPDPVPEWINRLYDENDDVFTRQAAAELFRAHVEERAKDAARRWCNYGPQLQMVGDTLPQTLERLIAEEMLR